MANRIITPPSVEPVTLAEMRAHLNIVAYSGSPAVHPDDAWIEMAIVTAREWIESYIEQSIGTQTREEVVQAFPEVGEDLQSGIPLQFGPVQSITSVKYYDGAEADQTLAASYYTFDDVRRPARVVLAPNQVWPTIGYTVNGIRIRYQAGFTNGVSPDAFPTPNRVKHAVFLLVAHWYENREASAQNINVNVLPFGVDALLWPLRQPKL